MTVQTVGPQTAVAGTPLEFDIGSDRAWIQVHNDTPNKLYIQFDGGKPIQTSANVGAGYGGYVPPWSHPVIFTPGQSANSLYGFQGKVWVMPVSVASQLATTGQGSSLAEVHLDAGSSDDPAPQSWSMPRQQDATSQQRVISLAPVLEVTGTVASPSTNGNVALPTAGNTVELANLGGAVWGTTDVWFALLYHLTCWPNLNGTAGGIDFQILVDIRTSGGASIGGFWPKIITRGQMYWGATDSIPVPYSMPGVAKALPFGASPGGSPDHVSVLFKSVAGTGPTSGFSYDIGAYIFDGTINNTGQGSIPQPVGFPANQGPLF